MVVVMVVVMVVMMDGGDGGGDGDGGGINGYGDTIDVYGDKALIAMLIMLTVVVIAIAFMRYIATNKKQSCVAFLVARKQTVRMCVCIHVCVCACAYG